MRAPERLCGSCAATRTSPATSLLARRQAAGLRLLRRPAHRVGCVDRRSRWSPRTPSRCPSAWTSAPTGVGSTPAATTGYCGPGTCTATSSSCAGCSRCEAEQDFIDVTASPDGRWLAYVSSGSARELGPLPRHRHGEEDAREGPRRVIGAPWSPGAWHPDGRHYAIFRPVGRRHRAGCRDWEAAWASRGWSSDADIYSIGYVDQGERLLVGDSESRVELRRRRHAASE